MHYVIGLGNPGKEYINTRHNVGKDFLTTIAKDELFPEWEKSKNAKALYVRGMLGSRPVEFLLPETYMNKSGESVLYLSRKHNVQTEQLIVVYDDVALPVGDIKVSVGRGSGGHNGIKSIIDALGTKDFARIRIGVASRGLFGGIKRPSGDNLSKHVLGSFSKSERDKLNDALKRARSALQCIIENDIAEAMNIYN